MPGISAPTIQPATLRSLLDDYNKRELGWAIVCGVGAVLLWLLTYAAVVGFVVLILSVVFSQYPHTWLINSITLGVMALLVFEAIRYRGELFEMERYERSLFGKAGDAWDSFPTLRENPFAAGWGIAQLLLCAPRCTIAAWRHARSRLPIDEDYLDTAVKMFTALQREDDWRPVPDLGPLTAAAVYLHVTEIIWVRVEDDDLWVQLAPTWRKARGFAIPG